MKNISDTSHTPPNTPSDAEAEKAYRSDSDIDDTPSSGSTSPSASHRGRSVTPVEGSTAFEKDAFANTRRSNKKRLSSRKASKQKSENKPEKSEQIKNPALSEEVIEWQGSTEKQLEKLVSNVKAVQESERARNEAKELKKAKKTGLAEGDKPDRNIRGGNDRKASVSHSSFSTPAKPNPGFFHFNHPDHGMKMSRSDLQAHLGMVEKIEDILLEVLQVSGNRPAIHTMAPEAFDKVMGEIDNCVDEWSELPPEDTEVHPREALKELIEQYKIESGGMQEDDPTQMSDFIAQCRQLFPIEESGSLNKADTHHHQKPAPVFVRKVSGKIRDMLKYQKK